MVTSCLSVVVSSNATHRARPSHSTLPLCILRQTYNSEPISGSHHIRQCQYDSEDSSPIEGYSLSVGSKRFLLRKLWLTVRGQCKALNDRLFTQNSASGLVAGEVVRWASLCSLAATKRIAFAFFSSAY